MMNCWFNPGGNQPLKSISMLPNGGASEEDQAEKRVLNSSQPGNARPEQQLKVTFSGFCEEILSGGADER